jgi:indole-3-glycerol phosphate synthase
MSFLEKILASTRADVEQRRRDRPLDALRAAIPDRPDDRRFLRALRSPGMSVIAEFKRSSPTEGLIAGAPVLEEMVAAYEEGGASALSILTEATRFGGSLDDLRAARAVSELPILRKDFIIDRYQVLEAAEAGADAILLIVAAFLDSSDDLRALHDEARERSMDVLVEVRDEHELEIALSVTEDLVGINNRDLDTFQIHPERTAALAAKARSATVVSESGLNTTDDLKGLARAGVGAALIGTALMRAPSPRDVCREFSNVPTRASLQTSARPPAFA